MHNSSAEGLLAGGEGEGREGGGRERGREEVRTQVFGGGGGVQRCDVGRAEGGVQSGEGSGGVEGVWVTRNQVTSVAVSVWSILMMTTKTQKKSRPVLCKKFRHVMCCLGIVFYTRTCTHTIHTHAQTHIQMRTYLYTGF